MARTMAYGMDDLSGYFKSVNRQEMMTAEEELRVARQWRKTGNQRLADKLASANLRFVIKVALEYRNYGFSLQDLIQEGNMGLVRSVKSFDPEKGFRLISYAVWWIRAYIQEYILKNWSLVKIGTTQLQRRLFNHLQSSQKRMELVLASDDEGHRREKLAEAVGGTVADVEDMERRMYGRDMSLDRPVSEDEGATNMHDRLAVEDGDAEHLLGREQVSRLRSRELAKAMERLDERERQILTARHLGEQTTTLRELGEQLGVSKERVRQLESRALRCLKSALANHAQLEVMIAA